MNIINFINDTMIEDKLKSNW